MIKKLSYSSPIAANKTQAKRSEAEWLAVLEVHPCHLKPGNDDGMNTRPSNRYDCEVRAMPLETAAKRLPVGDSGQTFFSRRNHSNTDSAFPECAFRVAVPA